MTIPEASGFTYSRDGVDLAAGTHSSPQGATVVVTARTNDGAAAGSWTHRFPTIIVPTGPSFNDYLARVTIPADVGVRYSIRKDGQLIAKDGQEFSKVGTYTDADGIFPGDTITVDVVIIGTLNRLEGTTHWEHTFPVRPGYSLSSGDEFNDPSPLVAAAWTIDSQNIPANPVTNVVYRRENIAVADGNLTITTRRHCVAEGQGLSDANISPNGAVCPEGTRTVYASGRVLSPYLGISGPFSMEVRARMAPDKVDGRYFSAWLKNGEPYCSDKAPTSDIVELDTMEVYSANSHVSSATHVTCGYNGSYSTVRNHSRAENVVLPGVWHTYKMTWDGYVLRYYLDGTLMATDVSDGDVTAQSVGITEDHLRSAMNDHDWQLILNAGVFPKDIWWTPKMDDSQPFAERVDLIDYVRIAPMDDVYPHGAIGDAWQANRWLGAPLEPEQANGGGAYQLFQGGAINWSPSTGAHITTGAIRTAWATQGYERGKLGLPITDEICGLKDNGCYQTFQGGQIHWSPNTGAHITWGAIAAAWASQNWENGRWGYPISDEYANGNQICQNFQRLTACWSSNRGVTTR